MEKAYRYRIYPNKNQKEIIAKTFGCCRFVYNTYLAKRIEIYEKNKETFTYVQCANDMKKLKSELEWLKEVDSTALQSSLKIWIQLIKSSLKNMQDILNLNQRKHIDFHINQSM